MDSLSNVLGKDAIIRKNVSGRELTTLKCGGKVKLVCYPETVDALTKAVEYATAENIDFYVLGNGSNVIIKDGGYSGLVIKTNRLKGIKVLGDTVEAGAGVRNYELVDFTLKNGLAGLEFLSQIPATVGGMAYSNAGAIGHDFSDVFVSCETIKDGKVVTLGKKDVSFGYRTSDIDGIIFSVTLSVKKDDRENIYAKIKRNAEIRKNQPKLNTCGSVFINPVGRNAGKMLDDAGVKGYTFGKMKISEKHANFIVNTGGGTSAEAIFLIDEMKRIIKEKYDVELVTEIRFLGDD